uniref:Uncharacterized protein n=1 Tax=Trichobilharzia regenti TaxID=157069 RepID=A0AA85IV29_TRIRE|nr:unnamed protein product [Trichobilharzia regenti]
MNHSASPKKPPTHEPELFDLPSQLKIWAVNMFHTTATKEQKKHDPVELGLRFIWDDIFVTHEKPEYFDNVTVKLPKSHTLFSTTFKNNTDSEQEYSFRTERCTRSTAEIEIQKGVIMSKELSIKLALPSSIMEANAGFKHEISIGSSTRQSTEEELAWGVDTRISVPARHSASAEVKISEEEMNCCFRLKSSMYGRLRVLFLDPVRDNSLVKYLEDRTRENGPDKGPHVWTEPMKSGQRVLHMEIWGKCKFRFGVHQAVEVNQKSY